MKANRELRETVCRTLASHVLAMADRAGGETCAELLTIAALIRDRADAWSAEAEAIAERAIAECRR